MDVLIIDDSAFMRKALHQLLDGQRGVRVIGTARDGQDALDKIAQLGPQLVTLDIEMPVMDGLQCLRRIGAIPADRRPLVVMCSSLTTEGSKAALTALELGAADFVAKDASIQTSGLERLRDDLVERIVALEPRARMMPARVRTAAPPPRLIPRTVSDAARANDSKTPRNFSGVPGRVDVILIGSSTGGPPVVERLVRAIPASLNAPVVIAQHMPELFTASLAERLNSCAAVPVIHGGSDMPVEAGRVYIVRGGKHGRVERMGGRLVLRLSDQPTSEVYRPSVNELFGSAAKAVGSKALAVVLTGMGEDGRNGAAALRAAGASVLAQDEASCVVYGMPRAVVESGLATAVLTPDALCRAVAQAAVGSEGLSRAG